MCVEERLVYRCAEKVSVGLPEGRVFCCVEERSVLRRMYVKERCFGLCV